MKNCNVCKTEKPFEDFARNASRPDGYQQACRACRKAIDAVAWQKGREARLAQRRRRERELMREVRDHKATNPCLDCGNQFHPAAMQFDHRPGEVKEMSIANLVKYGRLRVWAEIAKCDLVCANCHAVRTFLRREGDAVELAVG